MAHHRALQAVGATLIRLLQQEGPADLAGHSHIAWLSSGAHTTAPHQGLTLMLYRVNVQSALRHPPRPASDGLRQRAPLVVDLHWLISAWSPDAATQTRLLGWALRCLDEHAVLPASLLNSADPAAPVFADDEALQLALEPLSLDEQLRVWNAQAMRLPVSLSYVVRGVALDGDTALSGSG